MPEAWRYEAGMPISLKVDENMISVELLPSMETHRTSTLWMVAAMMRVSCYGRTTPSESLGPNIIGVVIHVGSSVGGEVAMWIIWQVYARRCRLLEKMHALPR